MSCLFNSLASSVNLSPAGLRKTIVEYLSTNPLIMDDIPVSDVVKWTDNKDLKNYTDDMSSQSTWGGALEIKAFCELYSVNVIVHVLYTKKEFSIQCSQKALRAVHIKYNGGHFDPAYIEILSS